MQAHLELMEAHDRLDGSRRIIDDHLRQLGERSKTMLDEAELKRHLRVDSVDATSHGNESAATVASDERAT